jgi:FkbM family methyltransferase
MIPSLPIRAIRRLPFGGRLALRIYNRALMHVARKRRVRTYFGATLDCDARDMIQATLIHFRAWEPNVSRAAADLLVPGDTAVDVGANIGYYSLLFSSLVGPDGQIVAIEALPGLAATVRKHARCNGADNIRVVNMAASDQPGELPIFQAPQTNIGMTTTRADRGFPASGKVAALPLDAILTDREKADCALIKMDIEGGEVPVVRRLLDTLDQYPKHPALAVEVSPDPEWSALFGQLLAAGYEAFDLHNDYDWFTLSETPPTPLSGLPARQADVLFVHHLGPHKIHRSGPEN